MFAASCAEFLLLKLYCPALLWFSHPNHEHNEEAALVMAH